MFIEANDLLNRVPNGTKDTIEWRNGKLYHIQRVQEYTLQASDITALETFNNVQLVRISYNNFNGLSLKLGTTFIRQKFGKENYRSGLIKKEVLFLEPFFMKIVFS